MVVVVEKVVPIVLLLPGLTFGNGVLFGVIVGPIIGVPVLWVVEKPFKLLVLVLVLNDDGGLKVGGARRFVVVFDNELVFNGKGVVGPVMVMEEDELEEVDENDDPRNKGGPDWKDKEEEEEEEDE